MTAKLSFFPVGNGDMTLMTLDSSNTILIDCNIRAAADDPDDDTPDVAAQLRKRLRRDTAGRLYVDAFLLSHPDRDHCVGLRNHFHLGPLATWSKADDKIIIREMWSSPMVFRRASKNHVLCKDAAAWNAEARRRVKVFRDSGGRAAESDRILILGEDENGKTDDLEPILIKVDQTFSRINYALDTTFSARLLAPLPKQANDDEEDTLSKNKSSTILQFLLAADGVADVCRFLTGGDAEVAIWDRLWERHQWQPQNLSYDVLLTPHHCSWHSLSYDSWSEFRERARISKPARNALSQTRRGALLIASSCAIKDDDNDPPCVRARREYEHIAADCSGEFKCVGENPSEAHPEILDVEITRNGPKLVARYMVPSSVLGSGAIGRQPLGHG